MRFRIRLAAASFALIIGGCGYDATPPVKPPPPPMPQVASASALDGDDAPPPRKAKPPPKSRAQKQMDSLMLAASGMTSRDATQVGKAYAKNALVRIFGGAGTLHGRHEIELSAKGYFDAFESTAFGVSRIWQKGATWAVEWTFAGTQIATFMGITPKTLPGAAVGMTGLSVVTFDSKGLIAEERRYVDGMTTHDQLIGHSPVRAAPAIAQAATTYVSKGGGAEDKLVEATKAFYVALDGHHANDIQMALAPNATYDDFTTPSTLNGKTAIYAFINTFGKTVPDAQHIAPDVFAADGFTIVEWAMTGTHAPTNKIVDLHGVDVLEWKDGMIASASTYRNALELLGEIGKMAK